MSSASDPNAFEAHLPEVHTMTAPSKEAAEDESGRRKNGPPPTSKKDDERELRDNESARSSRPACWYWLNGNCRNPRCWFRHPPLDRLGKNIPDPAQATSCGTVYAYKYNVPCYYYFNSHCKKGDSCLYLHDTLRLLEFSHLTSEANGIHPVETQTSFECDRGPTSDRVLPNLIERPTDRIRNCSSEEDFHQRIHDSGIEQRRSSESLGPECEEPGDPASTEKTSTELHSSPEQCSEQLPEIHASLEEFLQSSPGLGGSLDALVNVARQELRKRGMVHNYLHHNDSNDPFGYERTAYFSPEYEPELASLYLPYDDLSIYQPDDFERIHGSGKEKNIVPMVQQEWELLSQKLQGFSRNLVGLHRYLRNNREDDDNHVRPNYWRQHYDQTNNKNKEPFLRNPLGSVFISSLENVKSTCYDGEVCDQSRRFPRSNGFGLFRERQGYKRRPGKPHSTRPVEDCRKRRYLMYRSALPYWTSRTSCSKKLKPRLFNTVNFTGPKILAEIKEQKGRADVNGEASASCVASDPKRYESIGDSKSLRALLELMSVDPSFMITQEEQTNGQRYIDCANEDLKRLHLGDHEEPHADYATESMEEDDDADDCFSEHFADMLD